MGAKIIMNTLTSYSQELADKVSGTIIIDLLPWYPQTGEADIADKIIFHGESLNPSNSSYLSSITSFPHPIFITR